MNILTMVCAVLGIAMLIYFIICFMYAGLSTSFTMIWFLLGLGMFAIRYGILYISKHHILIPKPVKIGILTILAIVVIVFAYTEAKIIYHANQKAPDQVEYVIVLGARVKGTTITGSLQRRLDTAVSYLQKNTKSKVIVSGGKGPGEDISEAQAMYDYLIAHGIEATRITKEENSTNTLENIKYSREIIQDDHAEVAIITNGFHIYRATQMAKMQGMTKVYGLAASSDSILRISYYTREAIAVLVYQVKGQM